MMRIVLFSLVTLLTTPLYAQNEDCQDYRTGKYNIVHEATGSSVIERTEATQIEYHPRTNLTLKLDVNWVESCTFRLKLDEVLKNPNDIQVPEKAIFTVEIIEIEEDSYVQRTTSNIGDEVMITEAVRIK